MVSSTVGSGVRGDTLEGSNPSPSAIFTRGIRPGWGLAATQAAPGSTPGPRSIFSGFV